MTTEELTKEYQELLKKRDELKKEIAEASKNKKIQDDINKLKLEIQQLKEELEGTKKTDSPSDIYKMLEEAYQHKYGSLDEWLTCYNQNCISFDALIDMLERELKKHK